MNTWRHNHPTDENCSNEATLPELFLQTLLSPQVLIVFAFLLTFLIFFALYGVVPHLPHFRLWG